MVGDESPPVPLKIITVLAGFPKLLLYNNITMKKGLNDTLVAFRWNKLFLDTLKMITHQESVKRKQDLSYSDLIRESLEKTYQLKHK